MHRNIASSSVDVLLTKRANAKLHPRSWSSFALAREAATALRRKPDGDSRTGGHLDVGRRADLHLLPDVDNVIAMAAEIRLAAHDAGEHVVAGTARRHRTQQLEVVRLDADRHVRPLAGEIAAAY